VQRATVLSRTLGEHQDLWGGLRRSSLSVRSVVVGEARIPAGLGPYSGRRDEVFAASSGEIRELATCPNVHIKLGELGSRQTSASPDAPGVTARGTRKLRLRERVYDVR
jgi:hypothetical protein